MPTVEQYGPSQITTQVVRGARAQVTPLSQQPAAQLSQAVSQVADVVVETKQRENKTRAEEALVAFEREKNDILFNPDSGYYNLQGRNAYDNAAKTQQSLNELSERYAAGLESQEAREMFKRVAANHLSSAQVDISRHAAKGQKAWEIATQKATIENTIENASLMWTDPKRYAVQRELGRQTVIEVANEEGITGEALNERLQTYNSSMAASAIESALSTSYNDAVKAMEEYGDDLEGPVKVKFDKALATKKKQEEDQARSQLAVMYANRIVDQHGNDRTSAMEALNSIDDEMTRSAARKELTHQLNALDKAETQRGVQAYEDAYEFEGSIESFKAAFPEKWDAMTVAQRRSLEKGDAEKHDWNMWYEVALMPDDKLAKLNSQQVRDMASNFDRSHRDKFISMIDAARNPKGDKDKVNAQVGRTRAAQVKSTVEQLLGKNASKFDIDDKRRVDMFYQLFDTEVAHRESELERPLSTNEFTDMLNGFTRKITINKSLFGFEYESEVGLTDIPNEDIAVLTNYLRQNNIEVTKENLYRAYQQASE